MDNTESFLRALAEDKGYGLYSETRRLLRLSADTVANLRKEIEQLKAAAPHSETEREARQWCQPGDVALRTWVLAYDDPGKARSLYHDEAEARAAYERAALSWNCYLLAAAPREGEEAEEHKIIYATVRESSNEEWLDIECRFANGEKYAAVQVDIQKPELAQYIAQLLSNSREASDG